MAKGTRSADQSTNSDAANALIQTAGAQKAAGSTTAESGGNGSTETPGTTEGAGTQTQLGAETGTSFDISNPGPGPLPMQNGPANEDEQEQKDRVAFFDNMEGEPLSSFINQVKDAKTEDLQKLSGIISVELGMREVPGPEPYTFQNKQPEVNEGAIEADRVARYGENYVEAKHPDGRETIFTAATWRNLPASKDGWQAVIKTPPEVEALTAKKS